MFENHESNKYYIKKIKLEKYNLSIGNMKLVCFFNTYTEVKYEKLCCFFKNPFRGYHKYTIHI